MTAAAHPPFALSCGRDSDFASASHAVILVCEADWKMRRRPGRVGGVEGRYSRGMMQATSPCT